MRYNPKATMLRICDKDRIGPPRAGDPVDLAPGLAPVRFDSALTLNDPTNFFPRGSHVRRLWGSAKDEFAIGDGPSPRVSRL